MSIPMHDPYVLSGLVVVIGLLVWVVVLSFQRRGVEQALRTLMERQREDRETLMVHMAKEYGLLKADMVQLFARDAKETKEDMETFRRDVMNRIDLRFTDINARVESRLGQGFEQTSKTFSDITERLGRIDEAQKKIEALSTDVVSLSNLLSDKKARGAYGEVQLNHILSTVFGEHSALHSIQKTLSNNTIADAVIHAPDPVGMIAVDAKFPLENYQRMLDEDASKRDRNDFMKAFSADMRTHVKVISEKYIIPGETSQYAIMFIPAEAVFAELTARHGSVLSYAVSKNVWITSPTTLIATLSVIQMTARNIERDRQSDVIIGQLNALGSEFRRYAERWDAFRKSLSTVTKKADLIDKTSVKITHRFESISNATLDQPPTDDEEENDPISDDD
jgi:DNA recombination protein RmuC